MRPHMATREESTFETTRGRAHGGSAREESSREEKPHEKRNARRRQMERTLESLRRPHAGEHMRRAHVRRARAEKAYGAPMAFNCL